MYDMICLQWQEEFLATQSEDKLRDKRTGTENQTGGVKREFPGALFQCDMSKNVNGSDSNRILKNSNPHSIRIQVWKSDPNSNLIWRIGGEPSNPIRVESDQSWI